MNLLSVNNSLNRDRNSFLMLEFSPRGNRAFAFKRLVTEGKVDLEGVYIRYQNFLKNLVLVFVS